MDAKLSLTTHCNARCATCPVWEYQGEHMDFDKFKLLWIKLMLSKDVHRVLLNNTGDMYIHPDHYKMFKYIETHKYKPVIMTTNAARMDYVPKIDHIIISFNGGSKETYEKTTGLNFEKTVQRIKSFYPQLSKVYSEIHCLMWDGNEGDEEAIKELWSDFPGRVRLSYKYDNQMKEDHTIEQYKTTERIPCEYLEMLSIMPDGTVVSCAHDFEKKTNFGNALTEEISEVVKNENRKEKRLEHGSGKFKGLCKKCNFNTAIVGKIVYIK